MSVTGATTFQFMWRDRSISQQFRAGVSLHSHTMYSEESLETISRYTAKLPFLGPAIRFEGADYQLNGHALDFRRAFWTPPLTPQQACRLEQRQIEAEFQIPSLVSITDHDDIRACTLLKILDRFRNAPISTEWSVPYGTTLFHLGIHNVPYRDASDIMQELTAFTADPREEKVAGI